MSKANSPSHNHDLGWRELERETLAAQLAERAPMDALRAMCNTVREHFGTSMEVSTDGVAPETHTHRALVGLGDERCVVSWLGTPLDEDTNRRLAGLLPLVVRPDGARAIRAAESHRLRNDVAGIQANVELARVLVDAVPGTPQHAEILKALDHALTKCRGLTESIHALKRGTD